MYLKTCILEAGGGGQVARACANRGMIITPAGVNMWGERHTLPASEWKGTTQYARVICDLIKALANRDVNPLTLCPGAAQYMDFTERKAA